jgi:hypothetical protein
MKRCAAAFSVLIALFGLARPAAAQFTAEEVASWPRWEAFLAEARIVRGERLGEGVTKSYRLTLEKDGIEHDAAWKNVNKKIGRGVLDSWRYEVAAYRLDRLLDLNMVPPAVERDYRGKPGALILWIDFKTSLLEVMDQGGRVPVRVADALPAWNDLYYVWGSLIANDDPTQENIRFTDDWRIILIDHSRAFRSDKTYTERLIFGANGIKKRAADGSPFLFTGLPRTLYEGIKALNLERVKQAVGPYLTDQELDSLLARRKLLLDEIDELIKRDGEAKVLR